MVNSLSVQRNDPIARLQARASGGHVGLDRTENGGLDGQHANVSDPIATLRLRRKRHAQSPAFPFDLARNRFINRGRHLHVQVFPVWVCQIIKADDEIAGPESGLGRR